MYILCALVLFKNFFVFCILIMLLLSLFLLKHVAHVNRYNSGHISKAITYHDSPAQFNSPVQAQVQESKHCCYVEGIVSNE